MRVTSSARRENRRRDASGFTLIELLVTLVIIAIGLLGVAKLQAAAIAETGVARTRSLMTFQAEALAAAMRSNKAFWQSSTVYAQTVTIAVGGVVTQSPTTMTAPPTSTCVGTTSCTAAQLAYDDVYPWAAGLGQSFPTAYGSVACAGSATVPVTCDITLNWTEHTVGINRTTANGVTQSVSSMVLHIQP